MSDNYVGSQESRTLLDIHNWDDARAFIHSAAPAISGVLLGTSALSQGTAQLVAAIVGLIVAVTDATLSTVHTKEGFRKYLYPVLAALGILLAVLGVVNDEQWAIVTAVVPIFLGGGIANGALNAQSRRS